MEQEGGQAGLIAQRAEPSDHGLGGAVHEGRRGEGVIVQVVQALLLRHGTEIPDVAALRKWLMCRTMPASVSRLAAASVSAT